MVRKYEKIVKTDTGEHIDWILRRLFTFCNVGWRFILSLPSARHMHIAMQMDSEKQYFPVQLNYYSWLMNFFCMKMIWKCCRSRFSLLLGHKLCFYVNSVNGAWIIYRYIAFLSSWKLFGLCFERVNFHIGTETRGFGPNLCKPAVYSMFILLELINNTS